MPVPFKCLILDDSLSDQLELEMILSEYSAIETTSIATPQAFQNEISQQHYQLYLIDINLQQSETGIEVAKRISEPNAWVIFCSAFTCEEHFSEISQLNLRKFYLQKPVDLPSFRLYIENFLWSNTLN